MLPSNLDTTILSKSFKRVACIGVSRVCFSATLNKTLQVMGSEVSTEVEASDETKGNELFNKFGLCTIYV